jgi:hypothetical protein
VIVKNNEMIAWDPSTDDEAVIGSAEDLVEFYELHK